MMRTHSLLLLGVLVLAACGAAPVRNDARPERGLDAGAIIVGPTNEGHVYAQFGAGADRFPPPRLLFFAGIDPFSQDIDASLRLLYGSGGVTASTFRVDFATATGTRLQYRVLLPGSIVIIHTSGSTVPILHPTLQDLKQILLPRSPSLT
jgi:hypothetical protein